MPQGRAARPFKSRLVKKNEASSGDRFESWSWGDQRSILETGDSAGARSESGAFPALDNQTQHAHFSRASGPERGQSEGATGTRGPARRPAVHRAHVLIDARRRTRRYCRTDSPCKLERLRAADLSAKVSEGRSGVGGRRRIPPHHHKMGRAPAHGLTRSSQDPHKSTDHLETPSSSRARSARRTAMQSRTCIRPTPTQNQAAPKTTHSQTPASPSTGTPSPEIRIRFRIRKSRPFKQSPKDGMALRLQRCRRVRSCPRL
jgi:hypothetical protein